MQIKDFVERQVLNSFLACS